MPFNANGRHDSPNIFPTDGRAPEERRTIAKSAAGYTADVSYYIVVTRPQGVKQLA